MVEEHNSVQLQAADGHNLAINSGYRYSQVGDNFSNTESAINYLSFNYQQLMTVQRIFRIVDVHGEVLMEDSAIRAHVRMR